MLLRYLLASVLDKKAPSGEQNRGHQQYGAADLGGWLRVKHHHPQQWLTSHVEQRRYRVCDCTADSTKPDETPAECGALKLRPQCGIYLGPV